MHPLGMLLHNAANQLKREFERASRPYGLTMLQWRVMGALAKNDSLTQSALGALLEASPMTISDVLERLEAAELVLREVDPADSRAKRVSLTPMAQHRLDEMRVIAAEVYARALDGIDANDLEIVERALSRIVSNLDETKMSKDLVE